MYFVRLLIPVHIDPGCACIRVPVYESQRLPLQCEYQQRGDVSFFLRGTPGWGIAARRRQIDHRSVQITAPTYEETMFRTTDHYIVSMTALFAVAPQRGYL